jgi:dTDP-4-amino-4,6-dideoxygalactose transaminase
MLHRRVEALAQARRAITDRFTADAVVLCDSGTSALTLALRVAELTHPGPVAAPGYACFDIATALDAAGAAVRLYDLDPTTLGPDCVSLDRVLAAGARRVIVAPLYGFPLEWEALKSRCDAVGAILIEDAAQGSGSEWNGRSHGSLGPIAVLSFGRGKGRTAGGGGALLLRGAASHDSAHALTKDIQRASGGRTGHLVRMVGQRVLSHPSLFGIAAHVPGLHVGETRYRPPAAARALAGAEAAMIPAALAREAREVEVRREHAGRLSELVPPSVLLPRPMMNGRGGYLRLPIVPSRPIPLDQPLRRLGVAAGYPRSLAELDGFRIRLATDRRELLLGSRVLAERLLTLPTHSLLTAADLGRLGGWLSTLR